jgi:hypothetical protein
VSYCTRSLSSKISINEHVIQNADSEECGEGSLDFDSTSEVRDRKLLRTSRSAAKGSVIASAKDKKQSQQVPIETLHIKRIQGWNRH